MDLKNYYCWMKVTVNVPEYEPAGFVISELTVRVPPT